MDFSLNNSIVNLKISNYKRTEHCEKLLTEARNCGIDLSEAGMLRTLFFSADIYSRVQTAIKSQLDQNTFWSRLGPYVFENPLLFSIAETAERDCSVKFLLFVKPKWRLIAKNVFDKCSIDYTLDTVSGNGKTLSVFIFVQDFDSMDEWERVKNARSSLAQAIQQEIQVVNGVRADFFSLYLHKTNRASLAILSPGSLLELFAGTDRESNSYIRDDLGCLFRSSWEANVARILNLKGIKWEYEKQSFALRENILYLPDFFLDDGSIIEDKGTWDIDSRKKVAAFHKEHPEINLLLIDTDMYNTLNKRYNSIVPKWEETPEKGKYAETIQLVGMRYCASAATLSKLSVGDAVSLVREPGNKFDGSAILALNEDGAPIGHVSGDWSFIYASKMDLRMEFAASVKTIDEKVIHISIQRINREQAILHKKYEI